MSWIEGRLAPGDEPSLACTCGRHMPCRLLHRRLQPTWRVQLQSLLKQLRALQNVVGTQLRRAGLLPPLAGR